MSTASSQVTRLAPSPTGALHLGNARTFLANWAMARQLGWKIILRIEDLDGPRVKKGADLAAIDDLQWLGIDWDAGPLYQSKQSDYYRRTVDMLLASGHAYPCICTRKDVDGAASAPHAEDGAAVYAGTCRSRFATIHEARAFAGREPCIRFRIPEDDSAIISWDDGFRGPQTIDARRLGDFVIAKGDGSPSYQLAVVVDDAAARVTQVVRGDDLVESTSRQILLYQAMHCDDLIPHYTHLPLVVGADGRRLAKRHGDTRVNAYRSLGVAAERIRSLVGGWCGIHSTGALSAAELISTFSLPKMPRGPIHFSEADDRWLRQRE